MSDWIDEIDSYMFQTVGHDVIGLYQECLNVPLFRSDISGTSLSTASDYLPTQNDEVEDLYALLKKVKVVYCLSNH
jgi:diphthine-ammonia ligase